MAKAQKTGGQYRQMLLAQQGHRMAEPEEPVSFFRIRFYICLCLFLGYVILDYTKASVYEVDSTRIYAEETFARALDSIWVSEEETDPLTGENIEKE